MFIRIKKIKNQEYAYLVKNKWTSKGTRQAAKKYLGKVIRLKPSKDVLFVEKYTESSSLKDIVRDLVEWELLKHGFVRDKHLLIKDKAAYNTRTLKLVNGTKPLSLALNEGVLNDFTLKRILNFYPREFEHETMYEFAKIFVESGIKVPKPVFVDLYERIGQ